MPTVSHEKGTLGARFIGGSSKRFLNLLLYFPKSQEACMIEESSSSVGALRLCLTFMTDGSRVPIQLATGFPGSYVQRASSEPR